MGMTDGKRMDMEDTLTVQNKEFYFSAWCTEHGITQAGSVKFNNTTEIQTMEDAAKELAKKIDCKKSGNNIRSRLARENKQV